MMLFSRKPLAHYWVFASLLLFPGSLAVLEPIADLIKRPIAFQETSAPLPGRLVAQLPGFSIEQAAQLTETLRNQQETRQTGSTKQSSSPITELLNFRPEQFGFQFTNEAMASSLSQTYGALDPEDYRRYQVATLTWFFEPEQVCLFGSNPDDCVLTLAAERWLDEQLVSLKYGVCDGLAAATLYFWAYANSGGQTQNYTYTTIEDIFGDRSPQSLSSTQLPIENPALKDYVTDLFLSQNMRQVYQQTALIRNTHSPNQILDKLVASMQAESFDPYTLGIYQFNYDQNGNVRRNADGSAKLAAGHSIVPYAIADQGNGIYWVYVYDNNYDASYHQNHELKVVFNTAENSWFYQPEANAIYAGKAGDRNLDLTQLSWRNLGEGEYYECPFCDTTDIEISMVGNALLEGPDLDSVALEDQIAYRSGLGHVFPPTYYLSARSEPYSLRVFNPDNSPVQAALSVSGNDFVVGFEEVTLKANQQFDVVLYRGDLGVSIYLSVNGENVDQPVEIPTLYITAEDRLPGSASGTAYNFAISGIQLEPGKQVGFTLNVAENALYFGDNTTQADEYQLHVERLDANGEVWLDVPVTLAALEIGRFQYSEWLWVPDPSEGETQDVPEEEIPLAFYDGSDIGGEPFPEAWLEGNIGSRTFQSDPARISRGSNRASLTQQTLPLRRQ